MPMRNLFDLVYISLLLFLELLEIELLQSWFAVSRHHRDLVCLFVETAISATERK